MPQSLLVPLERLGEMTPVGRPGGQGRVVRPQLVPRWMGGGVIIKLYRRPPDEEAARRLAAMVEWERRLEAPARARLAAVSAWPLALVTVAGRPAGIAMRDLTDRFAVPFLMPSGRRSPVLLALEHLLGADSYLDARGLGVALDTTLRARVAERVAGSLAVLHAHGVAVSDLAPRNLLVSVAEGHVSACFIDCDSMVFRGRQALPEVETADWNLPAEFGESPSTRGADAYKLGLVVLRLFARSHDARDPAGHLRSVPIELRDLLYRALSAERINRPPAGEWQRALHEVITAGGLSRVPAPRIPPPPLGSGRSPSPESRRTAAGAGAGARGASSARPSQGAPSSAPGRARTRRRAHPALARVVVALWIVAIIALGVMLLSRFA